MISSKNFFRNSLVGIVLLRIILNAVLPLMDKTEARYAEIARIMYETNNWITPQIDYGVPFWAKPPLSTWLSALSMKIFGVNEFAVRFPALILSLLVAIIVYRVIKEKNQGFYLSAFVLFTLPQFLLHAGVVSTDASLMLATTLIMIGFWKQIIDEKKNIWGYLLFVGAGLGLLAKGPIALILTAPPIFMWALITKQFKNVFTRIPWLLGLPIMLIIALPWYYLAEKSTEGFIDYFVVGEHFKRFFDSGWKGDKYGFPKSQPLGIVWLFMLGMALPWVQVVCGKVWKNRKQVLTNKWMLFLLFWMLWTPLFFSISKSLIHTYVLPIMPPIALLVLLFWDDIKRKKTNIYISLILPLLAFLIMIAGFFNNNFENYSNTDKYLIESVELQQTPLYYLGTKSYSSQFYSKGKVEEIKEAELIESIDRLPKFYIIISNKKFKKMNPEIVNKLMVVGESLKSKIYLKE